MSGFEGTDIECSIRTEGNRTLERPGAWALLGRAERQDKRGDERRDRVPTLRSATDGRAARLVERSDEARGRTSPLPRRRMEAEELGRRRSGVRASPSPQRPRRGSPVVRRADPACPGESSCKCIRRDRVSCLGPYNRRLQLLARAWRRAAPVAKRVPVCCKPGLCGRLRSLGAVGRVSWDRGSLAEGKVVRVGRRTLAVSLMAVETTGPGGTDETPARGRAEQHGLGVPLRVERA